MKKSGVDWFLDPTVKCLFIRTYGLIDKQLNFENSLTVREDPRYENDFNVLSDVTDCEFNLTTDDLRDIAQFQNEHWPTEIKLKSAMVINSALAHGLVRTFSVYNEQRYPDLTLFNRNDPELIKKLVAHFELPSDYSFPVFLNYTL